MLKYGLGFFAMVGLWLLAMWLFMLLRSWREDKKLKREQRRRYARASLIRRAINESAVPNCLFSESDVAAE
jgi:hypothetical protein